MYQLALCDDDQFFASAFAQQLKTICQQKSIDYMLTYYPDIPSFLSAIENDTVFDLIFLDILILQDNGIAFARQMRQKGIKTDIIFVSSTDDYALDGYDVTALHYIVKSSLSDKLAEALDRFMAKHVPQKLVFQIPEGLVTLSVDEILYIETYGHDISIHTLSGKTIPYSGTLKEMEVLLSPYSFFRSHKSYLINLAHVTGISRYTVWISSGQSLPIGKVRYKDLQNSLIDYANKYHT
ncbi:MAG: response regulator transcription factor [Clostridia bacterium]|nr:response regulator transcription factor [Clostridia bacterium]NCC42320.1 response regulator transcription factor [Clostridia bacterium]